MRHAHRSSPLNDKNREQNDYHVVILSKSLFPLHKWKYLRKNERTQGDGKYYDKKTECILGVAGTRVCRGTAQCVRVKIVDRNEWTAARVCAAAQNKQNEENSVNGKQIKIYLLF